MGISRKFVFTFASYLIYYKGTTFFYSEVNCINRIILHSDMNSFYASAECLYHPELRDKPVAVVGDIQQRHGIILTKVRFVPG